MTVPCFRAYRSWMYSPQSQTLTEQRLKFWFQNADANTRAGFLQWAKQQPSS
ncbi:DUF2057 family protein [Enterobacter hormaechei]